MTISLLEKIRLEAMIAAVRCIPDQSVQYTALTVLCDIAIDISKLRAELKGDTLAE